MRFLPRSPALALGALLASAAGAQPPRAASPGPATSPAAFVRPMEAECLGLAFGRWTPALDARAAGHGPPPDARSLPHAPNGRDWAAAVSAGRDTTLMLFPAWWPAGVHVRLPGGARLTGDTVRGTATALVADGRLRSPRADVRAWLVPCGGAPAGAAGATDTTGR